MKAYWDGPDEESTGGEMEMLGGGMLLWVLAGMSSADTKSLTRRCAVYESGEREAMSGAWCHECGRGSGICRSLACGS